MVSPNIVQKAKEQMNIYSSKYKGGGLHIIYINSLGLSVTVTPDGQWPRTVVWKEKFFLKTKNINQTLLK